MLRSCSFMKTTCTEWDQEIKNYCQRCFKIKGFVRLQITKVIEWLEAASMFDATQVASVILSSVDLSADLFDLT